MAVAIHITGMLAAAAFTAVYVRAFGKRPGWWRMGVSFAGAVGFLFLYVLLTAILHAEVHSSNLLWLLLLCSWAILAAIRPASRAVRLSFVLLLYVLALFTQYFTLAVSPFYTDNPRYRRQTIRARAISKRKRDPSVQVPTVTFHRTPHTWFTNLYRVEPPAGSFNAR